MATPMPQPAGARRYGCTGRDRPLGKGTGPKVWLPFGPRARRFVKVNASKSAKLILEAVRAGYVRQCKVAAREFTENLDLDEIAARAQSTEFVRS
jgi:hypothetical protein